MDQTPDFAVLLQVRANISLGTAKQTKQLHPEGLTISEIA
jgi:hypothetical protein